MNLFGTDGIRGIYGADLTISLTYSLGMALLSRQKGGIVVVGRDTRMSGEALAEGFIRGINDNGGQVINLGIVPTNAVAHYVRRIGADYGVMISASHNPPNYNGLKLFDRYGVKICAQKQAEISEFLRDNKVELPMFSVETPTFKGADDIYMEDIKKLFPTSLKGIKIALDCCYGSAYKLAKEIFLALEATLIVYCDFNRGDMINVGCGATNTDFLQKLMKANGCELGFAFDGDADRIAVFEKTEILHPDRIFYAFAKYFKEKGRLNKNTVVGTILTDTGLEKCLNKLDITLLRTDVGDSKIYEMMTKNGLNVGGENSGHYILSDYATCSDAIINALLVSEIYIKHGSLLEYTKEYKPYKSQSLNISVKENAMEEIKKSDKLEEIKSHFALKFPNLKLVLRLSGTEPKIRIYVEGRSAPTCNVAINYLTGEINAYLDNIKCLV